MTKVVRVKSPGGVEQFEIAEIELPPPAADEVRIRQTAIGVNFVDIYQRSGLYRCRRPTFPVSRASASSPRSAPT